VFDWLGFSFKPKQPPLRGDIDSRERSMIVRHFPFGNTLLTWSGKSDGAYVLPDSVRVTHGRGTVNFYKVDGQMKASAAVYRQGVNPSDPKTIPLIHIDRDVGGEDDLLWLKKLLS
jgi:hypothetical protein